VAVEVGSAWVKTFKTGVNWGREAGKILGEVTRGGGSEDGVGVGVTLEVGSAWVKSLKMS